MFQLADWTSPQVGGLLSEVIMKEERQLREPKPQVHVQHPWNQDYLEKRDSHWGHVITRKGSDIGATRAKLGMSVPQLQNGESRQSRTTMIASRYRLLASAIALRSRFEMPL